MSDMSDGSREQPMAIETDASINARTLSRKTSATLRAVADRGHSFAIEHCGRVVGFLIPVEGRVPVGYGRRTLYEVPEPEPTPELDEIQTSILQTVYRLGGRGVPDQLVGDRTVLDTLVALAALETSGVLVKTVRGYELTDAGERHAKALGA